MAKLAEDLRAIGCHPFHAPAAVLLNEADMAYSRCIRCQTCDGFPCLVHAKSDAEVIAIRPALERPNVTLLRHARALRLETDPAGRSVTGVLADVAGQQQHFSADIVVVSCGAANSAALLLQSANDAHPGGLANGSGQVGRNYMFHNSQAVLALSLTPNDTMFQKTVALNEFYFGMDGFPYPMGNIQMIGKTLAGTYRAEKPELTALMPDRALPGSLTSAGGRRAPLPAQPLSQRRLMERLLDLC
jgi:choline dehydrogenase-like flavoprotein